MIMNGFDGYVFTSEIDVVYECMHAEMYAPLDLLMMNHWENK